VTRNLRTYEHFCLTARALERVGDRWSLLVVRDLLTGPKRFTDLMDRLGGITPKTLTQRLRELADEGVVTADREPGRREVWYALTQAGQELAPVVDALAWWGLRHAWRPPRPGERIHAEHLLSAVARTLEHTVEDRAPARWQFRFPDGDYLLACDGRHWSVTTGSAEGTAEVTITGRLEAFLAYLYGPPGSPAPELDIAGARPARRRFDRLLSVFVEATQAEAGQVEATQAEASHVEAKQE
jgi:DNA-binding HxlR family transcriptional regulator